MVTSFFQSKKVLITGAGGHLGSALVKECVDAGAQVHAVMRRSTPQDRLSELKDKITIVPWDIREDLQPELLDQLTGVDTIFHLACVGVNPLARQQQEMISVNVGGTARVLEFARRIRPRRFVYAGSCFEYANARNITEDVAPAPFSIYGVTKTAGWMMTNIVHQKEGLGVVTLRPFTMYGPKDNPHRFVLSVLESTLTGKEINVTAGHQLRDWVYIEDAAKAFMQASLQPHIEGKTFNVATGKPVSLKEVAAAIERVVKKPLKVRWGGLEQGREDMDCLSGDPTLAKKYLGWEATTSLDEGIRKTVDWLGSIKALH